MRRKSTRNAAKAQVDKSKATDAATTPRKTTPRRTSKRRRKSTSSESGNSDGNEGESVLSTTIESNEEADAGSDEPRRSTRRGRRRPNDNNDDDKGKSTRGKGTAGRAKGPSTADALVESEICSTTAQVTAQSPASPGVKTDNDNDGPGPADSAEITTTSLNETPNDGIDDSNDSKDDKVVIPDSVPKSITDDSEPVEKVEGNAVKASDSNLQTTETEKEEAQATGEETVESPKVVTIKTELEEPQHQTQASPIKELEEVEQEENRDETEMVEDKKEENEVSEEEKREENEVDKEEKEEENREENEVDKEEKKEENEVGQEEKKEENEVEQEENKEGNKVEEEEMKKEIEVEEEEKKKENDVEEEEKEKENDVEEEEKKKENNVEEEEKKEDKEDENENASASAHLKDNENLERDEQNKEENNKDVIEEALQIEIEPKSSEPIQVITPMDLDTSTEMEPRFEAKKEKPEKEQEDEAESGKPIVKLRRPTTDSRPKILERKIPVQKIKIKRTISSDAGEAKPKRKWGSGMDLISSLIIVDMKTVKAAYPNVQFLQESEVKLEQPDPKIRRYSVAESSDAYRRTSVDFDRQTSEESGRNEDHEDKGNIIAMNRKISIIDDSATSLKPPLSPAKNPTSDVLFITNLVRPFTLKQLRELLERTGKIKEEGFWTDRIKSKCYVQYETEEEAKATREALHGVHWPIGNGKKLMIDYSTEEELGNAKNPPVPPPQPQLVPVEPVSKSDKENEDLHRTKKEEPLRKSKERDEREARRREHVREWDVGKEDLHRQHSKSKSGHEHSERRKHSRRSSSPTDEYISKKKKSEDQIPQKLMDDLFQKTKATPSIYWQPLTPEEIATKQQQRLERMAEHKKRLEETTRSGRPDYGRGSAPYRRKYD